MGTNLFIPINGADATPSNINFLVDAANAAGDALKGFEWCDLFQGEGGYLLTKEQALAFTEGEAPWYVLLQSVTDTGLLDGDLFWCRDEAKFESSQVRVADWRALVKDNGDFVLFLKTRG